MRHLHRLIAWLVLGIGCSAPEPLSGGDPPCFRTSDCAQDAVCVYNRCLVPCEGKPLCAGCGDQRDCQAGADQFCAAERARTRQIQPAVSRQQFCANCHGR